MASLQARIADLITAIGTDYKSLLAEAKKDVVTFSVSGALTTTVYTARWYADENLTVSSVRASVGTAPTGAAIIVDVLKNGTTIFTGGTDRPNIAVSTNTDTGTPAVTSLSAGDYLTISVTQVGSTVAGSDLTVQVMVG